MIPDDLKDERTEKLVAQFFDQHILEDQTKLVSMLLDQAVDDAICKLPFTVEEFKEIESQTTRYEFEGKVYTWGQLHKVCENLEAEYQRLINIGNDRYKEVDERARQADIAINDPVVQKVKAWYLIDELGAELLKAEGEAILSNSYGRWWGRVSEPVPYWKDDTLIAISEQQYGN